MLSLHNAVGTKHSYSNIGDVKTLNQVAREIVKNRFSVDEGIGFKELSGVWVFQNTTCI